MSSFTKTPILALLFLQILSLSLANTKLPPPPDDYVVNKYSELWRTNGNIDTELRLGKGWYSHVHFRSQGGGGDYRVGYLIVDSSDGGVCSFYFEDGQTWGRRSRIYIDDLVFVGDSILYLSGYTGGINTTTGVDFLVRDHGEKTLEALKHISFLGMKVHVTPDYYPGYYLITKGYEPWTPVPEASTYGAAFSFSALAVGFIRKRKRKSADSRNCLLTPSVIPV